MKIRLKIFSIFMIVGIICSFFFCANFCFVNVKATEISPDVTRTNYKDYDFDESLFKVVYAIAKQLNCNQTLIGLGFDFDLFLKNRSTAYSPSYVESGIEDPEYENNINSRNQIVNDLRLDILDLTTGENAKYDCLKNIKTSIKNISGLNSMNLGFVKKLYLNDNEIEKIDKTDFDSMPNLQEIYCNNNKINKFELNTKITNLSVLKLNSNNLSNIDLSLLKPNSYVDLSNNRISDLNNIKFLNGSNKVNSLDLNFNNLTDLSNAELTMLNSKVLSKLNIGIQGFVDENLIAGDIIKSYNLSGDDIQNVKIKFSYFEGNVNTTASEYYDEDLDNTIYFSNASENETIYLPAGKIKVEFFSGESLIDSTIYPNFSTRVLSVKLPILKYSIFRNGVETDETYHEQDVKIEFYLEENENIPNLSKILQNAKIYSFVNQGQKSETYALNINTNGTFNCGSYVSFDGISSETTTVSITRNYIKGIVLGIVIIITIIVVIGAGYFIVRWYKAGAIVAPLSDKEIAALNRKKAKKQEEIRETLIRGAGKERYFKVKEDEEVLNDLNSKREVGSYYNANEKGDYDQTNYSEPYRTVGNNFERYNTEEFRNDFEEDESNKDVENSNDLNDDTKDNFNE